MLERPFHITVPNKARSKTFVKLGVDRHKKTIAPIYCKDVFTDTHSFLNYTGSHTFIAFGARL